jgi:hypothetical protein
MTALREGQALEVNRVPPRHSGAVAIPSTT